MIGTLIVLVLSATVITTLVNYFFFLSSVVDYTAEHRIAPTGLELFAASFRPLLVILPIVFVVLAIMVLLISHHIAGPLYRLKMYMKKVQDGDYSTRLKFRKSDAINDVADSFNNMLDSIQKDLQKGKND
jgi:methyl-accepting chemotaxis protein